MAESNTVKFGHVVFFKDLIHGGFLTCKKRKILMAVVEQLNAKAKNSPPDVNECCFTVLPKLSYSHAQRLQKHEKKHKDTPEAQWTEKIQNQIAKFRSLAANEETANKALIGKMAGSNVNLGATIMLYHVKSAHFLTLVKEGADIDKNSLKLIIAPQGSKSAWFDLMPGFKTSKLGAPVPYTASISLRNTKNDVFVHCSDNLETGMTLAHPYIEKVLEINCFVNPAVFSIQPFQKPSEDEFNLAVSSGDIVSLYHADSNSNLVSREGRAFFNQDVFEPGAEAASMDSSGLWVFEKSDPSWGGDNVEPGIHYRIKHATTGLVLLEAADGSLNMTKEYLDPGACWIVKPFQSGKKQVFVGSLAQFVNSSTGHFLSECGVNPDGPETELTAGSQVVGSDRDALEIKRPSPETLKILDTVKDYSFRLNNVMGRMNKEYEKSNDMVKAIVPESKLMKTIFSGMTITCSRSDEQNPMKRDGPPLKDWQDTYGEQLVIEQTMALLQLILVEWEISISEIGQGMYGEDTLLAMKLMMRFLRAVVKKHTRNQLIASKYLPWLGNADQLALPLAVVDTVASIYDDNRALLERVSDEAITELVDLMVDLHQDSLASPRFVDLLRMMCICQGGPVPSNQNKICEHFLMNDVMHCHVKMMADGGGGSKKKKKKDKGAKKDSGPGKVIPHISPQGIDNEDLKSWVPLSLFAGKTSAILAKALPDCNMEERIYRYHIQSLRLFVASCQGRNRGCTDYLLSQAATLGLSMDHLFGIVRDQDLPPFYRGLIADVLVALYVDREPNEGISPIDKIRIWQACDPPPAKRAQKTKVDPFVNFPDLRPVPGFTELREYLGTFYENTGGKFANNANDNSMIATMITISYTMLDFGFYHNDTTGEANMKDIAVLLDPLLGLLDGRKEGPDLKRFKFSDSTAPIWDARMNILKILEFAFDCRVNKRLEMTYGLYEKTLDKAFASNKLNSLMGTEDQVAADMSLSKTPWSTGDLKDLAENLFNKPLIPTKTSLAMSPNILNPPDFVKTLLDCILMDSVTLNVYALSLLNRHYGQRSSMIKIMQNVQVVVFEDVAILRYELAAAVSEVRRNLKWLMSTSDADREKGFNCVHTILDRCISLTTQNETVTIIPGAPTKITSVEVGKFQAMLLNLGMHTKLFQVLAMPFVVENTQGMELWHKIYKFFGNLVDKNPKNQGEMFKHLILFQRHMMLEPLAAVCANAISSVFRENKQLLEKLDDNLYIQIFKSIKLHRQAAALVCLETTVLLNRERHLRNSAMLMKRLAANGTIFDWWDGSDGRESLMKAMLDSCEGQPGDLDWHLAGLHLMATLCTGKAPDNEVKAQGLMSYFHVMERCTMFSGAPPSMDGRATPNQHLWDEVTAKVKKACVHFMTEVFLTSKTEDAQKMLTSNGAKVWPHSKLVEASVKLQRLWMLKLKRKLGFNVSDVSANFPRTLVQEAIVSLHNLEAIVNQIDKPSDKKKDKKDKKKKKKKSADEDVQDLLDSVVPVDMEHARGLADYVFKFLVPFVTAVLGDHYDHDSAPQIRKLLATTMTNLIFKLSTCSFAKAYAPYIDKFIRLAEEKGLKEIDDDFTDDSPVVPHKIIFKEGWGIFIQDFAKVIGIADLKRVLGAGIKNLALMLSKNNIPDSQPPKPFREVVYRMYSTLSSQPKQLTNALSTDLLRIARAMVFLEDAIDPQDEERIGNNWDLFIVDGPPDKSAPARDNLKYIQTKYANLEAGGAVAVCLSIPDPPTAMAALRLGMTLLEHGNYDAQMAMLKFLQRTQNSEFFYRLSCNLKDGCAHVKDWMKFVRTQKEMATRRTTKRSGSAANAVNPFIGFMSGTTITLRFMQMMCEGHNLEMQNFIRNQESNSISYNLVGEAVNLLTQITLAFRFAIDNRTMDLLPMLLQVLDFVTEAMQGSCLDNQDECSSNSAMSTYCSLLEECAYINEEGSEDESTITVAGEDLSIRMIKCQVKTQLMILLFSILEENYEDRITTHFFGNVPAQTVLDDVIATLDAENGAVSMESGQDGGQTHTFDGDGAEEDGEDQSNIEALKEQGKRSFLLLKMMEDRSPTSEDHPVRKAVQALTKTTGVSDMVNATCGQVEILRNKKVYRTHFITPDFVIEIKKRMVFFKRCQEGFESVPRSNPDEKVVVMNKNMKRLVKELDHMHGLVTDERTRDLVTYSDFIQDKPLLVAFTLIAWCTLFYGDPDDPYEEYGVWAEVVAHLLCLCQFLTTCVWVAVYWLIQAPIVAKYPPRKIPQPIPSAPPPEKALGEALEPYEIPLPPRPVPDPGESKAEKIVRIKALAKSSAYHLTYLLISFAALCGGPGLHWLLTFWFLDYFFLPYGEIVSTAIGLAGNRLAKILTGWILICSMFFGFFYFYIWHEDAQTAYKGKQCGTAYNCIIWGLQNGIKGNIPNSWAIAWDGGGIPEDFHSENGKQLQWLISMLGFIVYRYSFSGILTATVVGVFGGLSAKLAAKAADKADKCLICSLHKFALDPYGGMFKHTDVHHNPWNYLGYLSALKMGCVDEFTGLEQYVNDLVGNTLSSYLPVGTCAEMQLAANSKASGPKSANIGDEIARGIAPLLSGSNVIQKELGTQNTQITKRLSNLEGSMKQVCSALKVLAPGAFEAGTRGEE